MPNWCFNRVTVYGSTEDLSAFKEFVESDTSTLDFNRIMPEPAEIAAVEYHVPPDGSTVTVCKRDGEQDRIERCGAANPVEWAKLNWGTKWNVDGDDVEVHEDEDMLEYRFDTAWGPAFGIYLRLTERFPNLNISWFYDEPGEELAGYLTPEEAKQEMEAYRVWWTTRPARTASEPPATPANDDDDDIRQFFAGVLPD